MPFENHGNRCFTRISVINNAPPASGVYGLSDSRQWLYLGESGNIQADLFDHLKSPAPFLKEHVPSGFTFELSAPELRAGRLQQLVAELAPIHNSLAGGAR